jgi:hypothetical protein
MEQQNITTLVRRITINCDYELHVEISLNLRSPVNDDTRNKFERKNKSQVTPAGIHPRKLDLTAPVYLTVTL